MTLGGDHIVTSQIEHPTVVEVSAFLEENLYEVPYFSVDGQGLVSVWDGNDFRTASRTFFASSSAS